MDYLILSIAVISFILVIVLFAKYNKMEANYQSQINRLLDECKKMSVENERQNKELENKVKDSIANQRQDIQSIVKEFEDFSGAINSYIVQTAENVEDLLNENEKNKKDISNILSKILKIENELELHRLDIIKVDEAIKNYTDINIDSLKLNVIDNDSFLLKNKEKSNVLVNGDIAFEDLDPEKQDIFFLMENTNKNILITGKAGTGKSYLLKYYKQHTKKNTLYMAPTGIAALNIEGVTIHRAFGFDNLLEDHEIDLSKNQKNILKELETVVIDEISMVRSDIFNRIDIILKEVMRNKMPFGGKQVIVLGDLFQLPPVAPKGIFEFLSEKYGGIYFFNAPAFSKDNFDFRELKKIYRQSESAFIEILNRARVGENTVEDIRMLNEKHTEEIPQNISQLVATKDEASKINSDKLNKLMTNMHVYEAEFPDGIEGLKENDFPCDFSLQLKENSLVMMISNDLEENRWVNGTLGIVSKLKDDYIEVTINGVPYNVSKKAFSTYRCEFNEETQKLEYVRDKSVIQYPVILAYAITIHKSQGMTYQSLACNLAKCFAPGQAYVALSRCAYFDKLYLTEKVKKDYIFADGVLVDFYKNMTK